MRSRCSNDSCSCPGSRASAQEDQSDVGPVEQARLWEPDQVVETHAAGAKEILDQAGLGCKGEVEEVVEG